MGTPAEQKNAIQVINNANNSALKASIWN
jgi:hypothetical protein